jgi:hypothetical protein
MYRNIKDFLGKAQQLFTQVDVPPDPFNNY